MVFGKRSFWLWTTQDGWMILWEKASILNSSGGLSRYWCKKCRNKKGWSKGIICWSHWSVDNTNRSSNISIARNVWFWGFVSTHWEYRATLTWHFIQLFDILNEMSCVYKKKWEHLWHRYEKWHNFENAKIVSRRQRQRQIRWNQNKLLIQNRRENLLKKALLCHQTVRIFQLNWHVNTFVVLQCPKLMDI